MKEIILEEFSEEEREVAVIDTEHQRVDFQVQEKMKHELTDVWVDTWTYAVPFDHIRRVAKELK